jgi:hypothetical protein
MMRSPSVGFGEGSAAFFYKAEDILKKAFISASVLDALKSGSFKIIVKTDAMVDAHGYVNYLMTGLPRGMVVSILAYIRGLCTLLVLL